MSEIEEFDVISDDQGVMLVGNENAIDRFLKSQNLPSREIDMSRFWQITGNTSAVVSGTLNTIPQVGRWIKVTENSSSLMKGATFMKGSVDGVSRAVVTGAKGKTSHILEFVTHKGVATLTNPAMLAGAAGIMTQIALQQAMDEITDYLKVIDAKVDDVLKAQKDSVAADMLGAGFVIEEAFALLKQVGRVSEVTWSKVQSTVLTLARTQAYALLQLDGIGEKIRTEGSIAALLKTSQVAVQEVDNWLAIIARCSQLQDGVAVLELDRLFIDAKSDLEDHRVALTSARQKRLKLISDSVGKLQIVLDGAAKLANKKTLFNPFESPKLVSALNQISGSLGSFQDALDLAKKSDAFLTRLWSEAAGEARDSAIDVSKKIGTGSLAVSKKLGAGAAHISKDAASKSVSWAASKIPKGKKSK